MSIETQLKVHCDHGGCRDWRIARGAATVTEARRLLRRRGWRTRRNHVVGQPMKDLCPRHAAVEATEAAGVAG